MSFTRHCPVLLVVCCSRISCRAERFAPPQMHRAVYCMYRRCIVSCAECHRSLYVLPSCTRFIASRRRPTTQRSESWLGLWLAFGFNPQNGRGDRRTHSSPVTHCCYDTLLQGAQCCTNILYRETHNISQLPWPAPLLATLASELDAVLASKNMLSPVALL